MNYYTVLKYQLSPKLYPSNLYHLYEVQTATHPILLARHYPHHFTTPFFLCLATILRHHLICAKPQPFETPFTCVWPTFYDTILSVSWPPSLIPFFLYLATILRHHLICAKPQPFETPFTCVRPTFYDTILSVSWPPSFLRHPFNCVKQSFPFDTLLTVSGTHSLRHYIPKRTHIACSIVAL